MMFDKKGYLWIAHSMGICRYDGVNFTSFTNPEQSAVGMSGLLEDNYGRIWFHNFNGQIFYIKDEKMVYLKEYDFKNSFNSPRMVLCGEELVISSLQGIFICNTSTMRCRTEVVRNQPVKWGIMSLCVLNNQVLALTRNKQNSIWFIYTPHEGLLAIDDSDKMLGPYIKSTVVLESEAYRNNALAMDHGSNTIYSIALKKNKLSLVFKYRARSYINTVNIINNNLWINTRAGSFLLNGNTSVQGHNLTKILPDKNGNTWFGSLSNGLMVSLKASDWQPVTIKNSGPGDYVTCMLNENGYFILASQNGCIFQKTKNEETFTKTTAIPSSSGSIENIQSAGGSKYFLETSSYLYLLDTITKKIQTIDTNSVKSVAVTGNKLLMALSYGLAIKNNTISQSCNCNKDSFYINDILHINPRHNIPIFKTERCRAVMYDSAQKRALISFASGLYQVKNGISTAITFQNLPLYVSNFATHNNKIYAGTFNNGLFIINNSAVQKINNDAESPLDAITKIKCCNNHLWIFRTHDVQLLDTKSDKFMDNYPLPADVSDITDIEEDSSNIYVSSRNGLFSLPLNESNQIIAANPDLLYVLVNNTDTLLANNISLPTNKNNLLFRLSVPVYNDAERVHFKYSLYTGEGGTVWYYTQDAQRDIQFNALKHGDYTLKVIAVKDGEAISTQPLVYHFSIELPWYNTWWFYTVIALTIVSLVIAIQQYRLRQLLKIEGVRRKIATDLHDDIGSTLSSINVYSELAKRDDDNKEYINTIQQSTVSIINNLDDLVWNINPRNDVLDNMLTRMNLFAEPLLTEQNIECIFKVNVDNLQTTIEPQLRTNIYLLFKEMINNVVKHAAATICTINITQKGKIFTLQVKDNGKGFDNKLINRHRNGLNNMQQRADDIKGEIIINSMPGKGTEISVTCSIK